MTSRVGTLLRQWRLRAELSQEDLAARAELGVRTIRGLETGERADPRVGTLRMLADALTLSGPERAELFAAAGRTEPESEPQAPPQQRPPDPLAAAADALAHAVHVRWQREEEQRQVHDPVPLPVRWHPVAAELHDSWANIRMARRGESVDALDLTGRLDEIVDVHQRIPSGRLVVLGQAGSGKTILTTRFVLDLLARRNTADPVPAIFGLGSWDPTSIGLRDWLTERLMRDHPGLAAPGPGGTTLAAALVETGRILPVLDGFDEIARGLHRPALAALNATTLPMLVTSRAAEYRATVESTDVLTAAGAVELADLTADDLADYLPRTTRKTGATGSVWQPVLDEVRANPDGAVAEVLTTPLMVTLARTIYSDTPDHDPAELLDTERHGTKAAIERHLLGGFVPAIYAERPGARTHDTARVHRWFGYLADHLNRLGTYDLAWWQLGTSMRRRARAMVVAFAVGLGVGAVDLAVEAAILPATLFGRLVFFGAVIGMVAGVTFGLVHAHVVGVQPLEPSRVRLRLRGRTGARRPRVRARVRIGLLFGALVGFSYGAARGVAFWLLLPERSVPVLLVLLDALLFAVVFGVGVMFVFGLIAAFESPLDVRSAGSPAGLLRANRATVLVQLSLFVPVFALAVPALTWLMIILLNMLPVFGLEFEWSVLAGLELGLVAGIGGGIGYALSLTAWGQWALFARFWLPLTGRLPWSLSAFLDEAYHNGVLRRAGAVYQFRHARLQDHLAEAYLWAHR